MSGATERISVITTFREYNKNSQERQAGAYKSNRKKTHHVFHPLFFLNTLQSAPETHSIRD